MRWRPSRSPASVSRTNSGKDLSAGPENAKSIASTWSTISRPIGASQFAPPITMTASGFLALIRRARAKLATFCANIDVKPTMSAWSRPWRATRPSRYAPSRGRSAATNWRMRSCSRVGST